ncbi:MAG TPA: sulfatase-like hydrolase/transferase [Tepidisphaeraceae bacterium]
MSDPFPANLIAPERATKHARVAALIIAFGLYLCANLVLRWVKYPLFSGFDAYGWPSPTALERIYQIFMACLPVAIWGILLYALVSRFPRIARPSFITAAFLILLIAIELDMRWYNVSRRHGDLGDLRLLVTNPRAIGMEASDTKRMAVIVLVHIVVCVSAWGLSKSVGQFLARRRPFTSRARGKLIAGIACVIALFLIDGAVVGHMRSRDLGDIYSSQWEELARANPLRAGWADSHWQSQSVRQADLAEATAALKQAPPLDAQAASFAPQDKPKPSVKQPNIVVIVVESLSKRLMELAESPNYSRLRDSSIELTNHFTTGNCTHYGILGLLYGQPVTFFGSTAQRSSPFVRLFHQQGYKTRKLTSCREISHLEVPYEDQLTEPTFQCDGDWPLVGALRDELAKPAPRLSFVYYWRTHFPYLHRAQYNKHQPEARDNFDYTRADLRDHKTEITNRYLNCIDELDDWLGQTLASIDLSSTIVIFTGDHGEEFFERGRLSHCSSLDEPQIKVPMLIHVPGMPAQKIDAVTSHADVMPTLLDVLGLDPLPTSGRSIFAPGPRAALVAMDNHEKTANVWAVITDTGRVILKTKNPASITSLEDPKGAPVLFRASPSKWTDTLSQANVLLQQLKPSSTSAQARR